MFDPAPNALHNRFLATYDDAVRWRVFPEAVATLFWTNRVMRDLLSQIREFHRSCGKLLAGAEMRSCVFLTAAVLALAATPVYGGPREDVLAAMARCAPIMDDRTWLDCTYGAQQIMRAKLGLPPAPQFQQRLVPPASTPAPSIAAAAPRSFTAPAPQPQRRSGLPPGVDSSSAPLAVSTLARVQYDKQGAFVVTLDNGQVWRQANVDDGRKANLRTGTRVAITPGSLWTYNLKADGDPHLYKVSSLNR